MAASQPSAWAVWKFSIGCARSGFGFNVGFFDISLYILSFSGELERRASPEYVAYTWPLYLTIVSVCIQI